ncbi:MAG: DNA polymerase III subunit chi [Notoacmeibacter sp.]
MTEILFYHLTESTLEEALPPLLERSLDREWKVVVEAGTPERIASLNTHLWTYKDDGFLPHGAAGDAHPQEQPVYLSTDSANPNGANVRFHVDGSMPSNSESYSRVVLMFDGHNNSQTAKARIAWKRLKAEGHQLTYWQQNQDGRWEKKA